MKPIDLIIISQSEVVDYDKPSMLPRDRLPLFSSLVYPRMVHFHDRFRSHLDVLNKLKNDIFWNDADYVQRRDLMSIWNLPGFSGVHIANYLHQFGIGTHIINNFDAEWDNFCEAYEQNDPPPLVGISGTFYLNFQEVKRLGGKLRKKYPGVEIVLGGAIVNDQMSTEVNNPLEVAMKKYGVDYALFSVNSEIDLKNLIFERKKKSPAFEKVNNLAFNSKSSPAFSFQTTSAVRHQPVLGDIPAAWHELELPFVNSTVQMRTSAGCPFSCAFCSYPERAGAHNVMPLEDVERHLISLLKIPNVNKVVILDDTPNVPIPRWIELCRMFSKYDFEWFSFLRVAHCDENIIKLMKDSGCRGVYLGLESANNDVLRNMNKKITQEKMYRGINLLKKYDITVFAAFVLGFPGETEQTINDSFRFIENSGVDFYSLKEFYFEKNAPVYRNRESFGLTGIGKSWSHDTMDSQEVEHYKAMGFQEISNSVFIDPDTSLWYLAHLYDQGFSMQEVADIQFHINEIMSSQMKGTFDDCHSGFERISTLLGQRKSIAVSG